jgi:hypothetical protein
MKDPMESSPLRVSDPAAAAVFANPAQRRILLAFARADRSLSEASALLGVPLARVHYHARRLVALRLLKVVRAQKRGGRPIKIYRASATAYLVPLALMPRLPGPELAGALRESLEQRRMASSAGLLVSADREGRINLRHVGGGTGAVGVDLWLSIPLTASAAKRLSEELRALALRYSTAATPGGGGRPYILHAALAPRLKR